MSEPDFNDPVFLRGQLEIAVATLRARDQTTEQIVARLEAQYAGQYEEISKEREKSRLRFEDLERELRQVALRYTVLRQHQVRIRSLGLLAKGTNLDSALDAIIAQMGIPSLEKLTIEAGVHSAIRGTLQ